MSAVASRRVTRAPEKGVFPLDHFQECKKIADQYLVCLDLNEGDARPCKELTKLYLQCRMDRNLMAKQEMEELGIDAVPVGEAAAVTAASGGGAGGGGGGAGEGKGGGQVAKGGEGGTEVGKASASHSSSQHDRKQL